MAIGDANSPRVGGPQSAAQQHYEVREEAGGTAKLYIGGKACTVKIGGEIVTDKNQLQRLAMTFKKTVADQPTIEQGQVWKLSKKGITVFDQGRKANVGALNLKMGQTTAKLESRLNKFITNKEITVKVANDQRLGGPPAPPPPRPERREQPPVDLGQQQEEEEPFEVRQQRELEIPEHQVGRAVPEDLGGEVEAPPVPPRRPPSLQQPDDGGLEQFTVEVEELGADAEQPRSLPPDHPPPPLPKEIAVGAEGGDVPPEVPERDDVGTGDHLEVDNQAPPPPPAYGDEDEQVAEIKYDDVGVGEEVYDQDLDLVDEDFSDALTGLLTGSLSRTAGADEEAETVSESPPPLEGRGSPPPGHEAITARRAALEVEQDGDDESDEIPDALVAPAQERASVEEAPPPPPAPKVGDANRDPPVRGQSESLLDSIRAGTTLKKTPGPVEKKITGSSDESDTSLSKSADALLNKSPEAKRKTDENPVEGPVSDDEWDE